MRRGGGGRRGRKRKGSRRRSVGSAVDRYTTGCNARWAELHSLKHGDCAKGSNRFTAKAVLRGGDRSNTAPQIFQPLVGILLNVGTCDQLLTK